MAVHHKTMKLIELEDLSLQMKLSLEDKESLISISSKLKSQAQNEDVILGRPSSSENDDKRAILDRFGELSNKRIFQLEAWHQEADATFHHNSEVYLEGEIKFNLQDEWIVRDTMAQFKEVLEGSGGYTKHVDYTIKNLADHYDRFMQLSRPQTNLEKQRTLDFFLVKNEFSKRELQLLYLKLLSQRVTYRLGRLQTEFTTQKPELDEERVALHGKLAELEYLLNIRCKDSKTGAQFMAYWKALELGYFSGELIRQSDARISFILEPQMELLMSKISFLNKSIQTSSADLELLLDEEEILCSEIEALNVQRSEQLESVMGSYNFCKANETDTYLAKINFKDLERRLAMDDSEIGKVEKRISILQGLPSNILERVGFLDSVLEMQVSSLYSQPSFS